MDFDGNDGMPFPTTHLARTPCLTTWPDKDLDTPRPMWDESQIGDVDSIVDR